MLCYICKKPLNDDNSQWIVSPVLCVLVKVCRDDRDCRYTQETYNPVPKVRNHAQRFYVGG
jgi:hypothetical protein